LWHAFASILYRITPGGWGAVFHEISLRGGGRFFTKNTSRNLWNSPNEEKEMAALFIINRNDGSTAE